MLYKSENKRENDNVITLDEDIIENAIKHRKLESPSVNQIISTSDHLNITMSDCYSTNSNSYQLNITKSDCYSPTLNSVSSSDQLNITRSDCYPSTSETNPNSHSKSNANSDQQRVIAILTKTYRIFLQLIPKVQWKVVIPTLQWKAALIRVVIPIINLKTTMKLVMQI